MDSFHSLFHVVTATLPVSALIMARCQGEGFALCEEQGLPAGESERIFHLLEPWLRKFASSRAVQSCRLTVINQKTHPFCNIARVPITGRDDVVLGFLLALGHDGQGPIGRAQKKTLFHLARLAAFSLQEPAAPPAAIAPEASSISLDDAVRALPEAVVLFDKDERLVSWNAKFESLYGFDLEKMTPGIRFEDHLRNSIAAGLAPAAIGREEEWLAERMARFRAGTGIHEHRLFNGRWLRVQDRALANGGTIGIRTDITELVDRENSFRILFEANPSPMMVIDKESLAILSVNQAAIDFYGYSMEQFLKLRLPDIRPERKQGEIQGMVRRLDDPEITATPRLHVTSSGEEKIVNVNARVIDHNGRPAILAAIFDITERQRMEAEVRDTRAFLKHVVDNIPNAVFAKDMWDDGRYVIFNRAAEQVFGLDSEAVIGRRDLDILPADQVGRFIDQDNETMLRLALDVIDDQLVRADDGSIRTVRTRKISLSDGPEGRQRYVLGLSEDVTEQRAHEARIARLAHHDALTGLPNRVLFHDRLESEMGKLADSEHLFAILFIDLDGFKGVNDSLGHGAGDQLLKAVAGRLRGLVRSTDTIARFGGDEFAVILAPLEKSGEAAWVAARLVAGLSTPFDIDGHDVRIGASIGISFAPRDSTSKDDLLEQADAALYHAKREGKNRFRFADQASAVDLDRNARAG